MVNFSGLAWYHFYGLPTMVALAAAALLVRVLVRTTYVLLASFCRPPARVGRPPFGSLPGASFGVPCSPARKTQIAHLAHLEKSFPLEIL